MSILLSQRVQQIKPSATLAVSAKAAELRAAGRDVIGLGTGEPDFDTPEHIKEAAIEALKRGDTKYTAVDGTAALKSAIIEKFQRDNQLEYTAANILVSSGAKQTLYNLCQALLGDADEAIIPAPYWVSYPAMVKLAGAEPVLIKAPASQNFKITPAQLEAAITPKTRLLFLNSPSNPTGVAYSREEFAALGQVLDDYPHVIIASDEIYEHIYWGKAPFCSFATACPHLIDRIVVVNGASKVFAMTGWRLGYGAGPVDLIAPMKKIQSQSTSNPCSLSQAAAVAALNGPMTSVHQMVKAFKERHDYLIPALNAVDGIQCLSCDGAFYAFPDFSQLVARAGVRDDVQLAERILEQVDLALVPGTAFGAPGFIRISYAAGMETLTTAVQRLEDFVAAI
ncbi:MAG: pyridoxal phosphate-dependent aminotransferase [Gammaproteobacteria bacterium]|nr:pyridoxal phosphate-dependent aminotransferase [Gammaproteobacteria bacterium]